MLQIVDLAINNFSGKLPAKCFTTWEAMMSDENQTTFKVNHIRYQFLQYGGQTYYQDAVTVTIKGQRMDLVKIITAFTSIDFSSNHFEGEIPKELFNFKALYTLNLSNNAFSGQIPPSLGNLKELESLDLSKNSLEGNIPTELATLFFMSILNLFSNHLVGKIPSGTQLQSFPASSFAGNEGLYGPALSGKVYGKEPKGLPQPECGRLACTVDWNFICVELGFVFGLAIVYVPLLIWKRWRVWYWQLIHNILYWIFPRMHLPCETKRA